MKKFDFNILISQSDSQEDKISNEDIMANLDTIPDRIKQLLKLTSEKNDSISIPSLQKRIEALETALAEIVLTQAKEEE